MRFYEGLSFGLSTCQSVGLLVSQSVGLWVCRSVILSVLYIYDVFCRACGLACSHKLRAFAKLVANKRICQWCCGLRFLQSHSQKANESKQLCLPVRPSVCLPSVCPSVFPSVRPPARPSFRPSVRPPVCPRFCSPVRLLVTLELKSQRIVFKDPRISK